MKKILCLVLAILMTFALFGCAANNGKPAATSSAPAASAAATSASSASTAPSSAAAAKDSSKQATLVYICNSLTVAWCKNISDTMAKYGAQYNFKVIASDSNNDPEKYVQLVQTYCDQKVDGFIFNPSEDLSQRITDICNKAKIPFLFESTNIIDSKKALLTAGAELDANAAGALCGKWIGDNYKTLGFSNVNPAKVGLITITNSTFASFVARSDGAMSAMKAAFPGAKTFSLDTVSEGANSFSAEGGYNLTAATIAANPDVELWAVVGVLADWGQGAARAVEASSMKDKSIVSTVGGEILPINWDQGYTGAWKSCNYFTENDFVSKLVPGLMSVVRGEKTVKDLFPEAKAAGATYGDIRINGTMVTKDTYKAVREKNHN